MNNSASKLRLIIAQNIERDRLNVANFAALLPIVEKHDGKPCGKRFAADCVALGGSVRRIAGMTHVHFNNDSMGFLVSHGVAVSLSDYHRCNPWAGDAASVRIRKNTALLGSDTPEKMAEAADTIRELWNGILRPEYGTDAYEIYHDARRLTGLQNAR